MASVIDGKTKIAAALVIAALVGAAGGGAHVGSVITESRLNDSRHDEQILALIEVTKSTQDTVASLSKLTTQLAATIEAKQGGASQNQTIRIEDGDLLRLIQILKARGELQKQGDFPQ